MTYFTHLIVGIPPTGWALSHHIAHTVAPGRRERQLLVPVARVTDYTAIHVIVSHGRWQVWAWLLVSYGRLLRPARPMSHYGI